MTRPQIAVNPQPSREKLNAGSDPEAGAFGAIAKIPGAEIVGAKVGQFAFETFDIEPQRAAGREHQHRAAAGRSPRMKLDSEQLQRGSPGRHVNVARLAGQHPAPYCRPPALPPPAAR